MPLELTTADPDFDAAFDRLVAAKREAAVDVREAVTTILDDVRARGDAALVDYTARFDRLAVEAVAALRVDTDEIAAAREACNPEAIAALELAADRIRAFHERQLPDDARFTDEAGIEMGYRWTPIMAAGLYVPGGLASYPSSVLMNAVPARVAGVGRIAMAVPSPDGALNPLVLAAAHIVGIQEVWRIGGAQAVAALAYGTDTIAAVDKIIGPGNAYVAEAKRQVFGTVGIDMIAGPSEILVVADGANDPAWTAADLLSQAEHDEVAQAILITDDAGFAQAVIAAVDDHLKRLPRSAIAAKSWADHGAVIVVAALADAPPLIDRLAPEHLALAIDQADAFVARVHHAGSIFLGRHTPEAVGDYVGGPNHVLPTGRRARFSSGLSVMDFMKRSTLLRCSADGLARIGPAAITLAEAEGLDAHALSVAIRLGQ